MPGKVIAFLARPGDAVKARPGAGRDGGDEDGAHHRTRPRDGVVAELLYAVGDQVAEGGELLRLAARE
jgi:3-methylcrotonyl-CoA carboxylase alpha subunit